MTNTLRRGSSNVYDFPARNVGSKDRSGATAASAGQSAALVVADLASGGSWYHEEAVRTVDNTRKR